MTASIYAPDYLRAQKDMQLHMIANMIEQTSERIAEQRKQYQQALDEITKLKAENEQLNKNYLSAVKGRQDFREALRHEREISKISDFSKKISDFQNEAADLIIAELEAENQKLIEALRVAREFVINTTDHRAKRVIYIIDQVLE